MRRYDYCLYFIHRTYCEVYRDEHFGGGYILLEYANPIHRNIDVRVYGNAYNSRGRLIVEGLFVMDASARGDLRDDRIVQPPVVAVTLNHERRPDLAACPAGERVIHENGVTALHPHGRGLWAS